MQSHSLSLRRLRDLSLLAGALLAASAANSASGQSQLWSQQLGTIDFDSVTSGTPDGAGGSYLCGATRDALIGSNNGGLDVWLGRFDGAGTLLWIVQIGTVADDEALACASDGAGGVFVGGRTTGDLGGVNAGLEDAWLARYDGTGAQLWLQQSGTVGPDAIFAMCADGALGVIVSGDTEGNLAGPNAGFSDYWIARHDATGAQTWAMQGGSADFDFARAAVSDGAGGAIIAGSTFGSLVGTNAGSADGWLSRVDSTGATAWVQQFGTSAPDTISAAAENGAGGAFVSGATQGALVGTNAGDYDAFVALHDATGAQTWVRQLGTSGVDESRACAADGSGGAVVGGFAEGVLGGLFWGGLDGFLAAFDATGTQVWTNQLGTGTTDVVTSIVPAGSGAYVVAGLTAGSLGGPQVGVVDVWLSAFDTSCGTNLSYCTALTSSNGCEPVLVPFGVPSIVASDSYSVIGLQLEDSQNGLMFYGTTGQSSVPFFGGTLCVNSPLYRMPVKNSGGGTTCEGALTYTLTEMLADPIGGPLLVAGTTVDCQIWFRDPAAALTVGLTQGLEFVLCP